MNNVCGLVLSYLFVFSVIGIATLILRAGLHPYYVRKIVHIGVSNWWILAALFFTSPVYPAAGAVSFILINLISYRRHLFRAMESQAQKENLGTVYFPVSLLILCLLCFGGYMPVQCGAVGILVLGYGDGSAAIIGRRFGRHSFRIFGSSRSMEGSAAMFIVSFAVTAVIMQLVVPVPVVYIPIAVAAAASLAEAVTPFGLDNLSVPLISSFTYYCLTVQL